MPALVRLDRVDPTLAARIGKSSAERRGITDPETRQPRLLHRLSARLGVVEGMSAVPPLDDSGLSREERMAVAAWNARLVPRAPTPARAWNAPGHKEPVHLDHQGVAGAPAPEVVADAATVRYLVGSVAIGLVIVSRDQGAEQFTTQEEQKVVQETLEGTTFLTQAEPRANVSFDFDLQSITIDVAPTSLPGAPDPYEALEAPWRDAALLKMGYGAGRAGYKAYARDLAQQKGTAWSFVAFFTKYPVHHFAYAVYEKVVMHYANDGWGPDVINQVFAHEACHIFGAADEYGACGCHSKHGALNAPNSNCRNCPGTHATCLMDTNELQLCTHSRLQLGWGPPYVP